MKIAPLLYLPLISNIVLKMAANYHPPFMLTYILILKATKTKRLKNIFMISTTKKLL